MKRFLSIAALALSVAGAAFGQVVYSGGTYAQDFNSLSAGPPSNANIAWTDNSTLAGWYGFSIGAPLVNYRASTGSSNTGAVYSFGEAEGNTERALGSIASGTTTTVFFGARFTNAMGGDADFFHVQYTGEQWRDGNNVVAHKLGFEYSLNATSINDGAATWTTFTALDFTGPKATTTAGALNGNLAENQASLNQTVTLASDWLSGTDLWIRWVDPNDGGNDHGLAIDNLSFTSRVDVVPEPASLAALGIGALALIRKRRNKK